MKKRMLLLLMWMLSILWVNSTTGTLLTDTPTSSDGGYSLKEIGRPGDPCGGTYGSCLVINQPN
ncbi:MAG: hypothetical protein QNK37_10355 [Acidobacteriota bacterium]|nr:hypothetical protein [Acidobacteriota bacterium]